MPPLVPVPVPLGAPARLRRASRRPLIALGLVLLATASPARPWGAFRGVAGIKITDTHQQILRAAYDLLLSDPRFSGLPGLPAARGRFIPFERIVAFEGVDADPATLSPYGPGPDAEGLTLYSCHWYNPSTGQGLGPASAADWYQRFIRAVLGFEGGDEETLKGLAWSAHFLADMFVPYHLSGMPAGEALARIGSGQFILGPNEAGPDFLIDPAPPAAAPAAGVIDRQIEQAGAALSSWWRKGWGPGHDFREAFAVFADNHQAVAGRPVDHLDWFDPWYWNGLPSRSVNSSHATYEAIAHGRFLESGGYQRAAGLPLTYDPLWQNAVPDYAFAGTSWQSQAWQAQEFAQRCASRTLQNSELCWRQPERAVRAAIEAVFTLWRSAYSALQPVIQAGRDPARPNDGLIIRIHVQNHAFEPCHDASVRMSVRRGGTIVSQWTQAIAGPVTFDGGGNTGWFAPVDPNQEWEIAAEVVGIYDKTPDLQYGAAYAHYRPDPRDPVQRVFDQPRPVEEARIEDFNGEYSLGDPERTANSYTGTITFRSDGSVTGVEFVNGQRIEGPPGRWSFDRHNLYFSISFPEGGTFAGTIRGTTSDFTVTGRWGNGTSGTLRIYRRR